LPRAFSAAGAIVEANKVNAANPAMLVVMNPFFILISRRFPCKPILNSGMGGVQYFDMDQYDRGFDAGSEWHGPLLYPAGEGLCAAGFSKFRAS
jgi:hypothetical protein